MDFKKNKKKKLTTLSSSEKYTKPLEIITGIFTNIMLLLCILCITQTLQPAESKNDRGKLKSKYLRKH